MSNKPPSSAYATLTTIGNMFGLSAKQVGKVLTEQGYREPKTLLPTKVVLQDGLAVASTIPTGQQFWMWKRQDIANLLQSTGLQKKSEQEIWAHSTSNEIASMLKNTHSVDHWSVSRAWEMTNKFALRATYAQLKDLLQMIRKKNPTVAVDFETKLDSFLFKKNLQEVLQADVQTSQCLDKAKI